MRKLTDAERLVTRLQYEPVVLRRRCEGRFVRGRCVAVGGRGAADRADGVLYVLVEVRADAKVEEPPRQAEPYSYSDAEVEEILRKVRDGSLIPLPDDLRGKPS
jgi:hypothetical protein